MHTRPFFDFLRYRNTVPHVLFVGANLVFALLDAHLIPELRCDSRGTPSSTHINILVPDGVPILTRSSSCGYFFLEPMPAVSAHVGLELDIFGAIGAAFDALRLARPGGARPPPEQGA